MRRLPLLLPLALCASCASKTPPATSLDDQPPAIVSAFFGLDDALPEGARALCLQAPGLDGMPVTLTRRAAGAINPAAFTITTRSGATHTPRCATTQPADAAAERHTILLIGELGDEPDDPPTSLTITGRLPLDGGADARGLTAPVIPLAAGPTLSLALSYAPDAIDTDCPDSTRQLVVAVWSGGVNPAQDRSEADHLAGYTVTTDAGPIQPAALGDLGDNDNYVHLCLNTISTAQSVEFVPGILVDPNDDLNPRTSVRVSQ